MRYPEKMMTMKASVAGVRCAPLAFAIALLAVSGVDAQTCAAPDAAKRSKVESYVIARYKMPSVAEVILTESKQANDACFWMLKYESSNPRRETIVYLSPDGNYIVPALYDIRTDPLAEEAAARAQNLKVLSDGTSQDNGRDIGSKNASITIVEFADFECPFCKRMADVLRKDFLPSEGNQVRFQFRNFPLPMHPWAMAAAEMAECVTLQNPSEFWKVHDFLFDNQGQITAENLKNKVTEFVAASVAVDQAQYRFCVENDLAMGPVKKDLDLGQKLGIRGTPAIFVNGALYLGFKNADQLRQVVEDAQKGDFRLAASPASAPITSPTPGQSACLPRTPSPQ